MFSHRFSNFWPEGVLVDRHYSTNFNLRSIKNALKRVACEVTNSCYCYCKLLSRRV